MAGTLAGSSPGCRSRLVWAPLRGSPLLPALGPLLSGALRAEGQRDALRAAQKRGALRAADSRGARGARAASGSLGQPPSTARSARSGPGQQRTGLQAPWHGRFSRWTPRAKGALELSATGRVRRARTARLLEIAQALTALGSSTGGAGGEFYIRKAYTRFPHN